MSIFFLTGTFLSHDAYSINDFASIALGAISDITGDTVNGDTVFQAATFQQY